MIPMPDSYEKTKIPMAAFWILWAVFLGLHLAGLRRDLPYTPEINEPAYVSRALAIAATHRLDAPAAFPAAATVVYPLSLAYKILAKVFHTGLALRFQSEDAFYYYIGRIWTIFFSWLSLLLLYRLGARAFSPGIGLLAAALYAGYVLPVTSAQLVQADSAGAFFVLAFLWSIQRGQEQTGKTWPLLSGLTLGMAAATHYALGIFLLVYILVQVRTMIRRQQVGEGLWSSAQPFLLGLAAAVASFLVLQPVWLRHFPAAWTALLTDAGHTYGGGSFARWWDHSLWYLTRALRWNMGGLQIQMALVWLLWWRKTPRAWPLRLGILVWLAWISLAAVPAQPWINPILPLLALGCADLAAAVWAWCVRSAGAESIPGKWVLGAGLAAVLAGPVYWSQINTQWRLAHYSSRIAGRTWIMEHLPAGSRIAVEWLTVPLRNGEKQFAIREASRLGDFPLDEYRQQGFEYFLIGDWVSGAFWERPALAGESGNFYLALRRDAELLQVFKPAPWQTGPSIALYHLREKPGTMQP